METMNALYNRKSVRTYIGKKISEDALRTILKAASAAPVGLGKYDTVHLTVIENPDILAEIDSAAAEMFGSPDIHPLYGAPVFVLISVKPGADTPNNVEYSNAAIVVHNMALAAVNLGVGCCHIWGAIAALNQHPELLKKLNLPEGFVPCCGITLGETEEIYTSRDIPDRIATNYVK